MTLSVLNCTKQNLERAQNNGRKNDFYIFSFSVQGLHHYSLQSMRKFIVSKEQAAKDGTQLVNWVEKKKMGENAFCLRLSSMLGVDPEAASCRGE
jgi:hypothetical protein